MKMRVVSLFSGAGGFDLGFIKAGHEIVWANDFWEDAVNTYRRNIGEHISCCDIAEVDISRIPDGDIVIGGFPCQGFSIANRNRHEADERNFLYAHFVKVVETKAPPLFLAENVKGIKNCEKGKFFDLILQDFSKAGYNVEYYLLNAADYGVPQCRERVFFLGIRKDLKQKLKFNFPPYPTHAQYNVSPLFNLKPWISVSQALRGIPEPDQPNSLANHEASKYKLVFNGYMGKRKINPDLPCPTITARGDDRGGVVIHPHPNNKRRLTVREAALIQSFPIDFVFSGTKTSAYRQVANAVPPLLAEIIAKGLKTLK